MTRSMLAVLVLLLAVASAPGQGQPSLPEVAARCLAAPPSERPALAAVLRRGGDAGGRALLEVCLGGGPKRRPVPAAVLDLLFELCPASESEAVGKLGRSLSEAGQGRVLAWMARRDLKGFRDHETARAGALVGFLDDEPALAREAAATLANWDLALVANGLADRILAGLEKKRPFSRALLVELAKSLTKLRACAPRIEEVLRAATAAGGWLVPALLPGLGHRIDLVTAGGIEPWVRAKHPALRQAVGAVVDRVDRELFSRLDHLGRLTLFRRYRQLDPGALEWALREAHVAVMDLGSPAHAAPPLAAMARAELVPDERTEALALEATAAFLDGRDPGPVLRRVDELSRRSWPPEAPMSLSDGFLSGGRVWDDLELTLLWRSRVPPEVGEDELTLRRRRYRDSGGAEGFQWREAGRRRLALLMTGYVLFELRGEAAAARTWLDEAVDVYRTMDGEWNHLRLGEPGDFEGALTLRSGPLELLERALEGNEVVARRVSPEVRRQRLQWAERGFRALIAGLSQRAPDRVLPLPGSTPVVDPDSGDARERPFLDVTGALARFYQRIGEEDQAAAILDHLIVLLEGKGTAANERQWAGYLFDRASIAMDRRNPPVALERLGKVHVAYFDRQLRDVRLNPDRYFDPEAVRAWYSARLAQGHISYAVLYNVVMGELDKAREHCRTAYALDDGPFNRVLYACYLARDRRKDAALALLATVDPTPPLYYNMACTYALAGEPEQALEYLRRELELNHPTRKARNRQRDWAAKDRDLESLRQDPRFVEMVPKRPEEEEKR